MRDDDFNEHVIERPLHIPGKRLVITKKLIEQAQMNSLSNRAAAEWLGVSYNTYKKWAKYYGLFERHKNMRGKDIGQRVGQYHYKLSLDDITRDGAECKYPDKTLKKRLIKEMYMVEECSVCGYNEENIKTGKVCLRLDYADGDRNNKLIDNIRLLCPNCYLSFNGFFPASRTFCQ